MTIAVQGVQAASSAIRLMVVGNPHDNVAQPGFGIKPVWQLVPKREEVLIQFNYRPSRLA
jgi:hypothetical protein